jgi:hypothetical protein
MEQTQTFSGFFICKADICTTAVELIPVEVLSLPQTVNCTGCGMIVLSTHYVYCQCCGRRCWNTCGNLFKWPLRSSIFFFFFYSLFERETNTYLHRCRVNRGLYSPIRIAFLCPPYPGQGWEKCVKMPEEYIFVLVFYELDTEYNCLIQRALTSTPPTFRHIPHAACNGQVTQRYVYRIGMGGFIKFIFENC